MMCTLPWILAAALAIFVAHFGRAAAGDETARQEVANAAYRLTLTLQNGAVHARLDDLALHFTAADGPCVYRAVFSPPTAEPSPQSLAEPAPVRAEGLQHPVISRDGDRLIVRGTLRGSGAGGVTIEHVFTLPDDRPVMEERITVLNGAEARTAPWSSRRA